MPVAVRRSPPPSYPTDGRHPAANGKNPLLAEARRLHARGLWVLPCEGKAPALPDWPNRRPEWEQLEAMLTQPGRNLGLALNRSPFVDLECDTPEAEGALLRAFGGTVPPTPTWQSKRGKHRLFYRPTCGGFPDKAAFKVDGVEVRGASVNKGAQSVLPPSVHPDGTRYEWLPGLRLGDVEPAELPPAVVEWLLAGGEPTTGATEADAEADVTEGGRNVHLFNRACEWVRAGIGEGPLSGALHFENLQRCSPPLDDAEVWAILESAIRQASGEEIEAVSFPELKRRHPDLRPVVVEGIARQGETVNVVGGTKVAKTWFGYALAVAVANGTPFLGRFQTKRGRVLIIDNELHPETLAFRLGEVAGKLGLSAEDVDVVSLRGQESDYVKLAKVIGRLAPPGRYAAIVVDAHYRMLPQGTVENENSGIKNVFNLIDRMAGETGAAWFLIHHTTKGDQSTKGTTDVGAGAGAQSRAADTHLVIRSQKESGETRYFLDAAVRSFPPMLTTVLRWNFPLWSTDPKFTPEEAAELMAKLRRSAELDKVVRTLRGMGGERSFNEILGVTGGGKEKLRRLLEQLVVEGRVIAGEADRSGNRTTVYTAV